MDAAAIWEKLKGKKTYGLAVVGVFTALLCHFIGPITVNGNVVIPNLSWYNVWLVAYNGGFFASLKHGQQTGK